MQQFYDLFFILRNSKIPFLLIDATHKNKNFGGSKFKASKNKRRQNVGYIQQNFFLLFMFKI